MHIGLALYGSLEIVTGGFRYDRIVVEYLRRQGDQVSVISLPWRSYARSLLDNFSPGLLRRLGSLAVDVLVQDELAHPSLAWLNGRLRRRARFPLVGLVHLLRSSGDWPAWQAPLYRRVERRYLASLDGLIYVSQANRDLSQALLGSAPPGVVAYPAGDHLDSAVTPEQITCRALAPGPLEVIFVGSLIRRKALHTLVEALGRLPAGAWRLTAIGSPAADPDYARRVRRQIEQAGLGEHICLTGELPNPQVGERLVRSHVLVLPSQSEGFPAVYLEAMAHGLPVIASSVSGGAGELIRPGENGFLTPPGDPGALAGCLALLSRERPRLAAMGQAARRTFENHPTWEQTGAIIRSFLSAQAVSKNH
jgi:glycosyltransferase involved in cell wall biosynthesis